MKATIVTTLTGQDAINHALVDGLALSKYADPTEGARDDLTPDEARAIADEDSSLIYLEVELPVVTHYHEHDARPGLARPSSGRQRRLESARNRPQRAA